MKPLSFENPAQSRQAYFLLRRLYRYVKRVPVMVPPAGASRSLLVSSSRRP